jgi:hypothetical protein
MLNCTGSFLWRLKLLQCPYCPAEVVEKNNFCSNCYRQVKCLNCKKPLEEEKPICLLCGTAIGVSSSPQTLIQPLNKYSFKGEKTKDTIKEEITWEYSDEAAKYLPSVSAERAEYGTAKLRVEEVGQRRASSDSTSSDFTERKVLLNGQGLADKKSVDAALSVEQEDSPPTSSQTDDSPGNNSGQELPNVTVAASYFKRHGNNDLRPTLDLIAYLDNSSVSKKDKQQHFMVLYASAYRSIYNRTLTGESLKQGIKNAKVDDAHNFKLHFETALESYFEVDANGEVEVDGHGEILIGEIIKKIQNPPQANSRDKVQNASSGKRSGNQSTEKEKAIVQPWLSQELSMQVPIEKLGNKPARWVLFTFYVLIEVLKIAETIPSSLAYTYAVNKFPQLPTERKTFTDSVSNLKISGKLMKSQEDKFYLSDEGKEEARKFLNADKA